MIRINRRGPIPTRASQKRSPPSNRLPSTVAPLGAVGMALQTAATQATFRMPPQMSAAGIYPARRRRRRKKAKIVRRRRRRTSPRKARLVKGSAAAKRYMAKLRRMRKR